MTRFVPPSLSLSLLLAACAPAVPDIDMVVESEPSGTALPEDSGDCVYYDRDADGSFDDPNHCAPEGTPLDPDDNNPDITSEDGFNSPHQEQEEQYGCTQFAVTTWLYFDFEGGFHGDYEPEIVVIIPGFPDVTSHDTHAEIQMVEVPFEFRLEIQGEDVPPEEASRNTMVTLLDEQFTEVAELALLGQESNFLQYGCDPP